MLDVRRADARYQILDASESTKGVTRFELTSDIQHLTSVFGEVA